MAWIEKCLRDKKWIVYKWVFFWVVRSHLRDAIGPMLAPQLFAMHINITSQSLQSTQSCEVDANRFQYDRDKLDNLANAV